jgi:hypothetical protein
MFTICAFQSRRVPADNTSEAINEITLDLLLYNSHVCLPHKPRGTLTCAAAAYVSLQSIRQAAFSGR